MILFLLVSSVLESCSGQSILTNLRDQAYDLNQRPRVDFRSATVVSLQMSIFKLSNIDSLKQSFDVGLFIRETWTDSRLADHG